MENLLKGKKSMIWNYFTPDDKISATCNFCHQCLSYKTSISNLKQHLERKHPALLKLRQETQSNIATVSASQIPDAEPFTIVYVVPEDETGQSTEISFSEEGLDPMFTSIGKSSQKRRRLQSLPVQLRKLNNDHLYKTNDESPVKDKRSKIWNFFTPQNEIHAICTVCQKSLSYKSSITNLKKHIVKKHPKLCKEINFNTETVVSSDTSETEAHETTVNVNSSPDQEENNCSEEKSPSYHQLHPSFFKTQQKTNKIKKSANKIDEKLIEMITKYLHPFSIVEDFGFQEFCIAINPSYSLPSKDKLITELIPAKFNEITEKVKKNLEKIKSVTITVDCWTSYDNESFMKVMANFIGETYEPNSVLLNIIPCNIPYSNEYLNQELSKIVQQWRLENKILSVISDNVDTQTNILEELHWQHFVCLLHTINQIMEESLKELQTIINKVSDIVLKINGNFVAKHYLESCQKEKGKEPKKLIQCNDAQWNSVFYMLQRIHELKEEVQATIESLNEKDWPVLTNEELRTVEELIGILEPMESITKIVNKEKQITLSLVIILTNGLLNHYKNLTIVKSFSPEIKHVITQMVNRFNTKLATLESNSALLMSTFLDPRFKHVGFALEFSADNAKSLVSDALVELIQEKTVKAELVTVDNEDLLIWDSFDKKAATYDSSSGCIKLKAAVELERYIEQPLLNRNANPFEWWKSNAYNFPYLSELVLLKFGTVATSVPCKMLLSEAGQLINDRRNRLPAKMVYEIMFIGHNA